MIFDLDNDGDLDVVTGEFNDRPQVLVSNLTHRRSVHFLKVQLIGSRSNRDGLGATVSVHTAGKMLTQYHDGKSGYLAQSSLPLYFGLGETNAVEYLEIKWPTGGLQRITSPLANRLLKITEPAQ